MDFPTHAVLASFTKLCINKREIPYFDRSKLQGFLYQNKKDFPEILGSLSFYKHDQYSNQIEEELFTLLVSRMLHSWGVDFHPHETSKAMLLVYDKIEKSYKNDLGKLAQKFYDKIGCDAGGRIGKHTKFKSLEDLH